MTISLAPKNVSARRKTGGSVSWKSIIRPSIGWIVTPSGTQENALIDAVAEAVGQPFEPCPKLRIATDQDA